MPLVMQLLISQQRFTYQMILTLVEKQQYSTSQPALKQLPQARISFTVYIQAAV